MKMAAKMGGKIEFSEMRRDRGPDLGREVHCRRPKREVGPSNRLEAVQNEFLPVAVGQELEGAEQSKVTRCQAGVARRGPMYGGGEKLQGLAHRALLPRTFISG